MEEFRQKGQMFEADPRQTCYVVLDTDGMRPRTYDDQYAAMEPLVVSGTAPPQVRESFDAARALLVAAWCNVRWTQDAERRAYSTLEMALRLKLAPHFSNGSRNRRRRTRKTSARGRSSPRPTLRPLLHLAIRKGLLIDTGFRQYHRIRERREEYAEIMRRVYGTYEPQPRHPQDYTCGVALAMSELRNSLSHGSTCMHPWTHLTLELCCDIINQFYPS